MSSLRLDSKCLIYFSLVSIQQSSNSHIVCFIQLIKLKVLTDLIEISIDMPSFHYYYSKT